MQAADWSGLGVPRDIGEAVGVKVGTGVDVFIGPVEAVSMAIGASIGGDAGTGPDVAVTCAWVGAGKTDIAGNGPQLVSDITAMTTRTKRITMSNSGVSLSS